VTKHNPISSDTITTQEKAGAQAQSAADSPKTPEHTAAQTHPPLSFKDKLIAFLKEWTVILIIAAIGAWLCNSFVLMNTEVPTGSMVETIPKPSRIISSRVHYWFSDPERGDVILFDPPFEQEYYYVKRVIGLPGETVTIRNGLVYINDSATPLDEPYLPDAPRGNFGPFQVPEGCYFVMGDNRNHSNDSRHWSVKYVPRENIYAKALFVYWPRFSWFG